MALQMHLSSEICDSQSASFHPLNWLNSRTDYAKRVCLYAFFHISFSLRYFPLIAQCYLPELEIAFLFSF